MVTSALLRRYPLFSFLNAPQLEQVISISQEDDYPAGSFLFHEGEPAEWLYILAKGGIDLLFAIEVPTYPTQTRELLCGTIHPGEMFGISALIEPHIFTSSARTNSTSKIVKIHSTELLELCMNDERIGAHLCSQIAKAVLVRLDSTRLQLATTLALG